MAVQYEYDDNQQPQVTNKTIRFNGRGNESHETFIIQPSKKFYFCKTNHKPYDIIIKAILILLEQYGYAKVRWDGDEQDESYIQGKTIVEYINKGEIICEP